MTNSVRSICRLGGGAMLAVAGLWYLYGAAFQSWLSWGPPTSNSEDHRRSSIVFAIIALILLAGSAAWLYFLRHRRSRADQRDAH